MRRLVSALVTTTLAAGLLTAAPTAWADGCPDPGEPISGVSPTPDDVVLGPVASTSTRVFIDGYQGCFSSFENPYVRVLTPHRELIVGCPQGPPPFDGGVEYEGQLTIDTSELEDADAGTWLLSFEAEGEPLRGAHLRGPAATPCSPSTPALSRCGATRSPSPARCAWARWERGPLRGRQGRAGPRAAARPGRDPEPEAGRSARRPRRRASTATSSPSRAPTATRPRTPAPRQQPPSPRGSTR